MTRAHTLTAIGLAALALCALAATSASARVVRQVSSFTPAGVEGPAGIAVDQATGEVYVAGEVSHTVERFSASGTPEPSFVSPTFSDEPEAVAVDDSSGASKGDVYVAGRLVGVVKLDASGAEVAGFTPIAASSIPAGDPGSENFRPVGVAVDPSNGNVVVADNFNEEIDIFSSSGAFISQFGISPHEPYEVAVGADGDIFTASAGGAFEWSPSDGYATPTQIGPSGFAGAIAVDLSTGNVLVNEPDEPRNIEEYEAAGAHTLLMRFGLGLIEYSLGVAVDESTDTVYASSPERGAVEVFAAPENLPEVLTGAPATGVTATAADVSGTVNPGSVPVTSCRFEYGLSASYGSTASCAQSPGSGTSAVAVTASLTVHPDETYHYRLVAVNANGIEYGADETFQTEAPPPALQSESVSAVTQTAATLNATINPNDQATSYHFEYGTSTAYGSVLPVPDASIGSGYGAVNVGVELSGLQPGTTYHYRVLARSASSPAGGTVGSDGTFTTPALEPPVVGTGPAVDVGQSTATLTGTVDTQGFQTEYEFDLGTDTGYGTRIFRNAGSEPGTQTFTFALQGLMPGTTYHYRVAATNAFGTVYGLDVTFTTSTYPSAALTESVTPVLVPAILLAPEASASNKGVAGAASVKVVVRAARHRRAGSKRSGGRLGGRRRKGRADGAGHAHSFDRRSR
jgi:hypothetical protein